MDLATKMKEKIIHENYKPTIPQPDYCEDCDRALRDAAPVLSGGKVRNLTEVLSRPRGLTLLEMMDMKGRIGAGHRWKA